MNNTLKLGDRLFTGAIVTSPSAVATYNALTQEIAKREALGLPTEQQRNGRHNLFIAMANAA
jgi:hypothetical protein